MEHMLNKNQMNIDGPAISVKRALDYILNNEDKNSLPAKFLKLQKKLNVEERFLIRNDPQIVYEIFGININKLKLNDYYCWDRTTLSLFFFLKSFFQSSSNLKVLELGCGPYATLSVSLKKQFNSIHFSASDVIESKVKSAILTSKINISLFFSLMSNQKGHFKEHTTSTKVYKELRYMYIDIFATINIRINLFFVIFGLRFSFNFL